MRVRAKLTLRNEPLLARREEMGLTQLEASELCGIPIASYQKIESLAFNAKKILNHIEAISVNMDISPHDFAPEELVGKVIDSTFKRIVDVAPEQLPCSIDEIQMIGDSIDAKEMADKCLSLIDERERYLVEEVFAGRTYEDLAKESRISRERIRQIVGHAIVKIQTRLEREENERDYQESLKEVTVEKPVRFCGSCKHLSLSGTKCKLGGQDVNKRYNVCGAWESYTNIEETINAEISETTEDVDTTIPTE